MNSYYEVDVSTETPVLQGAPLAVLPGEVDGLAQTSLDDLAAALVPCPERFQGRAFWPIVDAPATLEPWQESGPGPDYEIDAEARQVRAVRPALDRDLGSLKAEVCAAIDAERDARLAAGVPFMFPGAVPGTVQTRPGTDDLVNIAGLATRAAVLVMQDDSETTIQFTNAENVTHHLIGSEFLALGIAVADARTAIVTAARAKKNAVAALSSAQDVHGYDAAAGWPA
jgi:hypothetical protein